MINLTNNIIIIAEGDVLRKAVEQAILDTHFTLLQTYAQGEEGISVDKITSTAGNKYQFLAFIRYVPSYEPRFNPDWVKAAFSIVHDHTNGNFRKDYQKILEGIGIRKDITLTLAMELRRGLQVFLLALWSQKAVLLPMNFSLPSGDNTKEFACLLYTEVLAIFRRPFIKELIHVQDISQKIKPTGMANFKSVSWRPVIASDWHKIEDINSEDLIALFRELAKRARTKLNDPLAPKYPLAPKSFLGPLVSAFPDRCQFDTKEVSNYNPRLYQTTSMLEAEVELDSFNTAYFEIKKVWLKHQKSYIENLKNVKKIKNIRNVDNLIGKFNWYLFSVLPMEGHTPPTPIEFNRKYMEGAGVPSLRKVFSRRDDLSALDRFFQYLEEIAPFNAELTGLINPVLSLDKPRERKPRQTRKKTFGINDFRLLFGLVHAIKEFSWYLAQNIAEGSAPDNWAVLLNDKSTHAVLSTEEFGLVPIVRSKMLDGTQISINLRWIPASLIAAIYVHLKRSPNQWTPIPNLHGIHQVVIGLETGLRHIHIRWLDKRTFLYSPVDANYSTFDLLVNTDKVTCEWVRPTSMRVLTVLERQIESQTWMAENHFETELFYDYHELSDFGKICPIFMKYSEAKVYSPPSMASYYHSLIYFFSQIKVSIGRRTADPMPPEIENLTFTCKGDFENATKCREKFKTKYTPHGLRASVVSVHAPILPPHLIGEEITGHVSDNTVRYYTVVDSDYIADVKALNRQMIFGSDQRGKSILAIRADRETSSLRNAVAESPISDVLHDYGAFSFTSENVHGELKSGMKTILAAVQDDIVINPTHMCPLRNQCPPEIVSTIGAKACGQCHYSVKTVDHLARILSHCRVLSRQYDHTNNQLKNASENNASEEALEVIENSMVKLAGEIAAWGLTAKVLTKNYEQLKGRVLVNMPDMLTKKLVESCRPDSELENLLIQCEEAATYPELGDSALLVDVAMVRARILAMAGSIEELFAPLDNYQMLDNFRGLLRGVCIATGKSPKELAAQMEKPLGGVPVVLKALEAIYD